MLGAFGVFLALEPGELGLLVLLLGFGGASAAFWGLLARWLSFELRHSRSPAERGDLAPIAWWTAKWAILGAVSGMMLGWLFGKLQGRPAGWVAVYCIAGGVLLAIACTLTYLWLVAPLTAAVNWTLSRTMNRLVVGRPVRKAPPTTGDRPGPLRDDQPPSTDISPHRTLR
jgi:hypothetical protein